jgi:lysophospholipase L1-like esterase
VRPSRVLVTGISVLAVTLAVAMTGSGASAEAAPTVHYVALGDSYAAGLGAGQYISSSGSCERSTHGYPELWAVTHITQLASFTFAACNGAATTDVINSQLSALSASTTLVSVTVGGNDVGFSGIIETCVLESTSDCLSAIAQGENFASNHLPTLLDTMLADIRKDAPSARIVIAGYPEFYDLTVSSCPGLSIEDQAGLDEGAAVLDSVLAAAAKSNHDVYASVIGPFTGHELCDSRSWMQAVTTPLDASYHPTAAGQRYGYLPAFTAAARR